MWHWNWNCLNLHFNIAKLLQVTRTIYTYIYTCTPLHSTYIKISHTNYHNETLKNYSIHQSCWLIHFTKLNIRTELNIKSLWINKCVMCMLYMQTINCIQRRLGHYMNIHMLLDEKNAYLQQRIKTWSHRMINLV